MSRIERPEGQRCAAKRIGHVRAEINKRKVALLKWGEGKEIDMSIDVAAAETNGKIRYTMYRHMYVFERS